MTPFLFSQCLVVVVALVAAPPADDVKALLAEAEAQVQAKDLAAAAVSFGQAAAAAHKANDLLLEQEVAEKLDRPLSRMEPAAVAALLKCLDPARSGAFVSAHAIATDLLLAATARADYAQVDAAAAVLAKHEKSPNPGKCPPFVTRYAEGLKALAAKKEKDAAAVLDKALDGFVKNGWLDLATSAGTELAAVRLRLGDEAGAAAAIGAVASACGEGTDPALLREWRSLVEKRLRGAPPAVLTAYEKAIAPIAGGSSAGAAGGAGGAGASAGAPAKSKVGAAWESLDSKKPFVTVARTKAGFRVREGFDAKFVADRPPAPGLGYQVDGGVTMAFAGNAVALRMIDPTGRRGQPGESSEPSTSGWAFYRLAEGESYGLAKSGVVSVTAASRD